MLKRLGYTYLAYCTLNYFHKAGTLELHYTHDNNLKEMIKSNQSLSKQTYYPSFFFPGGHGQTILLVLTNRILKRLKNQPKPYSRTRKIIQAKDGEDIYVDFFDKSKVLDNSQGFDNFEFLRG